MPARSPRRSSDTKPRPSDPIALRVQFLVAVGRKRIQEGKDIGSTPPVDFATAARAVGDAFWSWFRRWKFCRDVEEYLDETTQMLRDNWDELTEEQRKAVEADVVKVLEMYGEVC
jgi:hypothetical protein